MNDDTPITIKNNNADDVACVVGLASDHVN